MARERYLVGVNPQELEYTPAPPQKMTPKEWFSNLWYHYKWAILGGLFAVGVLAVIVWQNATKVDPDYRVCIAYGNDLPGVVAQTLEEQLLPFAKDLNGDGNTKVTVQILDINSKGVVGNTTLAANNRQAVVLQLSTRDTLLFGFDPIYYDSLMENLAKGTPILDPLTGASADSDGTYYVWNIQPLLPEEWQDLAPTPVYFGVRSAAGDLTPAQRKATEDAKALLEAYIAAQ